MTSFAQKGPYATLHLVHPRHMLYDTLLVKNRGENAVAPTSRSGKDGEITDIYPIEIDTTAKSYFSICFENFQAAHDTLYFRGQGKDLFIEIKDSFSLRDNEVGLKLKNVYNFEELYKRYQEYYNAQMQKYNSTKRQSTNNGLSFWQYALRAKLDFVKRNRENPYAIDLFAFFVIASPDAHYEEIYPFYVKTLKGRTRDPAVRKLVEGKIEKLKQSLDEGNQMPSFSACSIDNRLINNDSLSGKNILLIFWATWCGPCMAELPYLKQIHEQYQGDNLVMIGVSLDTDSLKMINTIYEKKMDWIHIFNDKHILASFRINPIPEIFLMDEKGVIVYNSLNSEGGSSDLNRLRNLLKQKFGH